MNLPPIPDHNIIDCDNLWLSIHLVRIRRDDRVKRTNTGKLGLVKTMRTESKWILRRAEDTIFSQHLLLNNIQTNTSDNHIHFYAEFLASQHILYICSSEQLHM